LQLTLKGDKAAELQKMISLKDSDIQKMRLDIEKLMKNLKDVTLTHSTNLRSAEEAL
jgi:Skp family chaperone for outer membrane proteins